MADYGDLILRFGFKRARAMRDAARKPREAAVTDYDAIPDEIKAEITADAAGIHDPQPARGRTESLREFLQRTPHRYEQDLNDRTRLCVCGLGPLRAIHYAGVRDVDTLLDTHAYITARLEQIRAGWPLSVPVPEAATEEVPRETIEAEPASSPDGVLGYLVACARTDGGVTGVVEGVTHTSPMDLEGARREARKHGVSSVREWFPVELRRVSGG